MDAATSSAIFAFFSSFIFWAAWIIIPIIMEIVPSVASLVTLFKRKHTRKNYTIPERFPDITIIAPIYNSEKTLLDCIASIDKSTYPNERIVVYCVDNGSKDNSLDEFYKAQSLYPTLNLHWLDAAQGKSRALNEAIYNTSSVYILHIDSDGILEPNALTNMVLMFENDPECNCVTGAILIRPDLIEQYPRGAKRLFRRLEFVEYAQAFLAGRNAASEKNRVYTLSGAFSGFRSSALFKSWMYNTDTLAEDTQITFQMRYLHGIKVKECDDALFFVDPIEGVDKLYTQRQRWQRGSLEVAKMFGGDNMRPTQIFKDVNVNTLMYDHTFAFPRVIWYLALFCLIFMGFSGMTVLYAMGMIFAIYIVCGYFYFLTALSYLKEFPETKRYYRKLWYLVWILPFFNFAVFFIRLAGIINSIGTTSAWKTTTLTEERDIFIGKIAQDASRVRGWINKVRHFIDTEKEKQ